jgi:hypothetical protein
VLSGLLVNQFDARYATHNAFLNQLHSDERIAPLILDTVLARRAAVTDRDTKGTPAAVIFDLPRSTDARERALKLCASVYAQIFPEEAQRIAAIEPEERFALAYRERLARLAEAPSPPAGAQTQGAAP